MTEKRISMPTSLTAKNGAKTALIGEFEEKIILQCAVCEGDGESIVNCNDECENCGGAGEYSLSVPVTWTTIKAIYKKSVELLGREIK